MCRCCTRGSLPSTFNRAIDHIDRSEGAVEIHSTPGSIAHTPSLDSKYNTGNRWLNEWDEQHGIKTFLRSLSQECQQNMTQIKTLFVSREAESLRGLLAKQSSLTIETDDTMHGLLCLFSIPN